MVRGVKVLGRVLVFGRVAAADVSAAQAQSEMNPGVADLEAVFASLRTGYDVMDLVEMGARFCHRRPSESLDHERASIDVRVHETLPIAFRVHKGRSRPIPSRPAP